MQFVPLESSRLVPLIAVPTLMLVLAWTTTMLRCWVKKQLLNTFAWDDWLMLLALVGILADANEKFTEFQQAVFTAMVILVYIAAANGTGQHIYKLPLENIIFCLHVCSPDSRPVFLANSRSYGLLESLSTWSPRSLSKQASPSSFSAWPWRSGRNTSSG